MSRVVIIGGSGHIGTYLVPRLIEAGYEVVNVTRGHRAPYLPNAVWRDVETVIADREKEDADGTFGGRIRALKPDIVIDMICFTQKSAEQIVEALRGRIRHFLHVGSIWVHGPSVATPTTEAQRRTPFGAYGLGKAAIEAYLLDQALRNGFPATISHPGHLVGPGWHPLNPAGHFNSAVFETIARGDELALPNFGMETIHHVHADDVAQLFMKAIASPSTSVGEAFHTVSPAALTLRGYAEAMYAWFGREPKLKFLPWAEWEAKQTSAKEAADTLEHITHSPCHSIAKAERLLGFAPRYSSLEGIYEAVNWLIDKGQIRVA